MKGAQVPKSVANLGYEGVSSFQIDASAGMKISMFPFTWMNEEAAGYFYPWWSFGWGARLASVQEWQPW